MTKRKSDDIWFDEKLDFMIEKGEQLSTIHPDVFEAYDNHSALKLIAINYWVSMFNPIVSKNLREPYGYKVIFVDVMCGSGVTKTRKNANFCGSTAGALLSANNVSHPFDQIIGVDVIGEKIKALEERLRSLDSDIDLTFYSNGIENSCDEVVKQLEGKTASFVVIDPHGLQGLSWKCIGPIIKNSNDIMVTWFEDGAWRLKQAALQDHAASKSDGERLTELLGSEDWKPVSSKEELTDLFIQRVMKEGGKSHSEFVSIEDDKREHYKMILFVKSSKAISVAKKWTRIMNDRLHSKEGKSVGKIVDVKTSSQTNLENFI